MMHDMMGGWGMWGMGLFGILILAAQRADCKRTSRWRENSRPSLT
jgi:hypothetical protein